MVDIEATLRTFVLGLVVLLQDASRPIFVDANARVRVGGGTTRTRARGPACFADYFDDARRGGRSPDRRGCGGAMHFAAHVAPAAPSWCAATHTRSSERRATRRE